MTIQLVTFDLDNTLWDVADVIGNAEKMMRTWLTEHVPEVVEFYGSADFLELRDHTIDQYPDLKHDLSRLRVVLVQRAIEAVGYQPADAEQLATRAFEVFYDGRHQVQYFTGAHETLATLKQQYRLASLTNGNADIRRLGLDAYFEFAFSAADVGASKPAPNMFKAALAHAEVDPHQAVHIGDHLRDDVMGAKQVGMRTILVRSPETKAPTDLDHPEVPADLEPDATVQSLPELIQTLSQLARVRP